MQTPTMNDPPLTWARFYRSLGWIPLPIASRRDVPDEAEHATRAKRPMLRWGGGVWIAQPPTDEQVLEWWGQDDGRGIFLLTGPGSGLTVIDVDTYKGGSSAPWESLATVIANTARGGVHLYFAESPTAKTDNDQRAPGVDIRGKGGGVVAPSGTGSAGREFVRFELPLAPYPEPAKPAAPPTMSTGGATLTFKIDPAKAGSFADVVSTTRRDGTKNASAKEIVGMLCRPVPLPADALAAALALLDGTAEEEALRPSWEGLLMAPMIRPQAFVVQFLLAWNSVRCDPPWPDDKVVQVAASLWRTASSSEATAPPTADAPTTEPPAPPRVGTEDAYFECLSTSGAEGWGIDEIEADFEREPLDWASLPGNLDYAGHPDASAPYGNGIGSWLNEGLGGGLTPGYFLVIGAKRAKGGKTAFTDQALTGLGMAGAKAYLAALKGEDAGPIMIPFVLSEMPLKDLEQRGAARYIGCDQSIFRRGRSAHLAPGIIAWANKARVSPEQMLAQTQNRMRSEARKDSLFNVARRLRRYINPTRFPVGERLGSKLLEHVAAIIRHRRAQVAQETGRSVNDIWPLLFVDPLQRYGDHEGGDVTSIDVVLNGLRAIANDDRVIVIATSDTNKVSASEGPPKKKEEKLLPDAMVAKVTRGTYAIGHIPDATIAIEVEPGNVSQDPNELERRALVYVGLSRWSAGSDEPYPFRYFPRTGRFLPIEPASERVAQVATTATASDAPGKESFTFNPNPNLNLNPPKRANGRFAKSTT